MTDLVSIIIPCYNQAKYLNTTLESVLKQTYSNWECILINDGSTDTTQDIIDVWTAKDVRFIGVNQKNGGLSNARNTGLKHAKGDWLQFLDGDDFLHPQKLELSLEEASDIVISDFLMFEETPTTTKKAFCNLSKQTFAFHSILADWDTTYSIPIHCGFFRQALVEDLLFNEKVKAREDWIFWLQLFKQKPSVSYLSKPLALYRTHATNMTKNEVFMFKNKITAYQVIFDDVLNDKSHKSTFFNRVVNEYADFKTRYFDLVNTDDTVKELAGYKKARDKYYNVWYRKYFYKWFKPKKYQQLYSS